MDTGTGISDGTERATGPAPAPDPRPLRLVLAANVVSISGNSLTVLAVPWFVLQTTGSAARAGLAAFCGTLPIVIAAIGGGPVIDRFGRRRTSVVSDAVCGIAVAAIPLLHFAGVLRFWQLCALMAVSGLFHAPGETAREVLLPVLAERAGTPLGRAAGYFDGASRGARMLGASLGGVLIAVLGAEAVLLVDAATFGVSALLIVFGIRGLAGAEPATYAAPVSLRTYWAELREGYTFLVRSRLLLAITLMIMVTNGLDVGWSSVLLPVHAERELGGSVQLGLLSGLFGAGALAGALAYGALGHRLPRWPVYTVCFLLCGAPRFLVAAWVPGWGALAATMVIGGLAAGALNPILSTVTFEHVPDELRSRALGTLGAGVLLTTPVGGLAAGYLVDGVGLPATLLAMGAVYFAATLCPLIFPSWRTMDAKRA